MRSYTTYLRAMFSSRYGSIANCKRFLVLLLSVCAAIYWILTKSEARQPAIERAIIVCGGCNRQDKKMVMISNYQNCFPRFNISQHPSPDHDSATGKPQLLVVAFSKPASFSLRNTSRNTWMRPYHRTKDIEIKFVVGLAGLEPKLQQEITEEAELYGDMVLLFNHTEGYGLNCTEKLLLALQWASTHSQATYLMKTDDDCYIRLECISRLLEERFRLYKNKPFLCGTIIYYEKPNIVGKWAEKRWTHSSQYLPYPYGSGYILPLDLVKAIVKSHQMLPLRFLTNEDVSMGLWVASYDIDYINIRRHHSDDDEYSICPGPQNISEIAVFHYKQSPEAMLEAHTCIPQQPCGTLCAHPTVSHQPSC